MPHKNSCLGYRLAGCAEFNDFTLPAFYDGSFADLQPDSSLFAVLPRSPDVAEIDHAAVTGDNLLF